MLSAVTWLNAAVQVFAVSAIGAPAGIRHVSHPTVPAAQVTINARQLVHHPATSFVVQIPDDGAQQLTQPVVTQAVASTKPVAQTLSTRRGTVTRGNLPAQQIGHPTSEAHRVPVVLAEAQVPRTPQRAVKAAQSMTPAQVQHTPQPSPEKQPKEAQTLTVRPAAPSAPKTPGQVTGAAPIPIQADPADDGSSYIFGPST